MDHPSASPGAPDAPVRASPDWLEPVHAGAAADPEPPHHAGGLLRRLVQMAAGFITFFLLVRTFALEPFGVPTGSMAPALHGNHREAYCPRCDYRVVVGEPGPDTRAVRFDSCRCPNCGEAVDLSRSHAVPGDRLMVDKTAYLNRKPRRWEVAVFVCPADSSKPYVKRIVGLPGELIHVSGGDVYAGGSLLRKTLAQFREVSVPVFVLNHPPRPAGWNVRWLVEPIEGEQRASERAPGARTAGEEILHDNAIWLDGLTTPEGIGLTYRHWNLDAREEEAVGDWLSYNGGTGELRNEFGRRRPDTVPDPAHDFAVRFDLEVRGGAGEFAVRLTDGADSVRADLPVGDGSAGREVRVQRDNSGEVSTGNPQDLRAGESYHVEFAFVDRRASLAVNGQEVAAPLDLPHDPPTRTRRGGVRRPLQLGVRGVSVVVRNLQIDRDIHYLSVGRAGDGWQLGPDEYFLLGDNTSNSHDSRLWAVEGKPTPGVPEGDFIGKPFLIHQSLRLGRVTFRGRERLVQTLDWSRLRWMR